MYIQPIFLLHCHILLTVVPLCPADLQGMAYLESQQVVHGGLALRNILGEPDGFV